ncbi:MAG: T9SS type A sorting domain-containing protein [candidate division KSB1 bacterium]|nr:T9SS type A sorting domain-containing protein [candidate division KSB1 bacterium]MDZ7366403.1 T9SS type A sorting domain-containing protein [candidate division KSB1 bacterium]MDZ7404058.1 T9SS type A sorting domain-containing protein [candidate division KSB1 bacterium]
MAKNWCVNLALSGAVIVAALAAHGKDDPPPRLGYQRVQGNDQAVVALLAQRIAQGLETNDPYLYLNLVAENLSKIPPPARIVNHDIKTAGGKHTLRFVKNGERWNLLDLDEIKAMTKAAPNQPGKAASGFKLLNANHDTDKTFVSRDLAPEHQLAMLSRRVTVERLQRNLFSLPFGSALFAKLQQFDTAPYFQASYVQFVTDPAWNRVIYGDYQKWIKAYDGTETGLPLNRPHGIAVDARGVVYVADTGNSRILVLKLTGAVNDLELAHLGQISGELSLPTEVAWDDRGTIFDASDDLLWVVDRGEQALLAYQTSPANSGKIVVYTREDFVELSALAVGRFDGRSDGNIYLADAGARKIHRLYFDGAKIIAVGVYAGDAEMVPTALSTDHWGNVYLSDEAHRKVQKFSPALEPLAELRPDDAAFQPLRFQPLFGTVIAGSQPATWSGYDQAFLLEKWTDDSGARRYELGMDFHLEALLVTEDLSTLTLTGKLTDAGRLKIEIWAAKSNSPIAALSDNWHNAGRVKLNWDRSLPNGDMIAPGYYKLRQIIRSTYERPENVHESSTFYVPLYYYDDCGVAGRDVHLVRGTRLTAREHSVVVDAEEIVYRYQNLNPAVAYEVKAAYVAGDDQVEQALYAGKDLLHPASTIDFTPSQTDWLTIPASAIADRALELRFVKTSGNGSASVAEIWLREANYDPNHPPAIETAPESLPQRFTLQQNYPNPFNPSTTIEFSLPENYRGAVSLRIYNMLGEIVRELVAGELSAGVYRQVWDGLDHSGRRLASGLYLYQLRAGSFSATRKLLLMK